MLFEHVEVLVGDVGNGFQRFAQPVASFRRCGILPRCLVPPRLGGGEGGGHDQTHVRMGADAERVVAVQYLADGFQRFAQPVAFGRRPRKVEEVKS